MYVEYKRDVSHNYLILTEEKQMQKNKYKKGKFYDRGCLCDVTGAFYFNRIALFMFFCT